jgi:hypothetical protein
MVSNSGEGEKESAHAQQGLTVRLDEGRGIKDEGGTEGGGGAPLRTSPMPLHPPLTVSPVAVAPSLAVMGRKREVRWAISGGGLTKGTEVNGGWHFGL